MEDPDATLPVPKPQPPPRNGNADADVVAALRMGMPTEGAAARTAKGDWQPPSVEDLQRALPQLEITAFLARGGMGAVYKGMHRALERPVAIKILPPGIDDDGDGQFAARFKQEARAMARLSHPNIVSVFDAGETAEGLLYFVMEFVEGTDVAQLIARDGRLEPQRAIAIIRAVCEALSFAHEEGIIHRDIKPSNVMLDKRGRVKVADFGLAKALNLESGLLTRSDVAMGTPDFIAPESLVAGIKVDHRADLYAVGVMLYQMLTGSIPRGRFLLPSAIVPQLDPALDNVVDKAMQVDRERRYSSAMDISVELVTIPEKRAELIPLPTQAEPSGRQLSPLLWAGVGLALLLSGGLFFWKPRDTGISVAAGATHDRPSLTDAQEADLDPELVKDLDFNFAKTDSASVYVRVPKKNITPGVWTPLLNEQSSLLRYLLKADPGIVWKDGWLSCNDRYLNWNLEALHLESNHGIRATFSSQSKSGRGMLIVRHLSTGKDFQQYVAGFDGKPKIGYGSTVMSKPQPFVWLGEQARLPSADEDSYTIELYAIGSRLIMKYNGQLTVVNDDRIASGNPSFQVGKQAMKDIEVISFNGMTEEAALKQVGARPDQGAVAASTSEETKKRGDAPWKSRWCKPGKLRAVGTDIDGNALSVKSAESYADFVQVLALNAGVPVEGRPENWVALRSNGTLVWSSGSRDISGGKIGVVRCEQEVKNILAGGKVITDSVPSPETPVSDFTFARVQFIQGSQPLVIAWADLNGGWHIRSSAIEEGVMAAPDLSGVPKVKQVVVGQAGVGVLREDGSLRIWHYKEMNLPDDLQADIKSVVPMVNTWSVLKSDGRVMTFTMAKPTANLKFKEVFDTAIEIRQVSVSEITAIASGGFSPLQKTKDGNWTTRSQTEVENMLHELSKAGNDSFSVFRGSSPDGQVRQGMLWIESAE